MNTLSDHQLDEIASGIANKSHWGPNTDNWTRIYQAARAGAVAAAASISTDREAIFRAGWDAFAPHNNGDIYAPEDEERHQTAAWLEFNTKGEDGNAGT